MKTVVSGPGKTVTIGSDLPTVLIGERINPSGKKKLAVALKEGDLNPVRHEARAQVEAGARAAIAANMVQQERNEGIPREDVIIECLALTLGADSKSAQVTAEEIVQVRSKLGVNQTLGASNVAFGS